MDWLDIASGFDYITPLVKTLRGFNHCIAVGQAAIDGENILKAAKIPCTFDVDYDGVGCTLSVRKEDAARAIKAIMHGT